VLGSADSLTDYFKVTYRISFIDYFNEFLYPFFQAKTPPHQRGSHREHEPAQHRVLSPEQPQDSSDGQRRRPDPGARDLAFLKDVFGSRAKIYPYGGHLGNMTYAANVAYMINVFKN